MKQTAVEWLIDQLWEAKKTKSNWIQIEAQAKAMEKEQIIEALMTSYIELLSWGISAEKYYNETFKSE